MVLRFVLYITGPGSTRYATPTQQWRSKTKVWDLWTSDRVLELVDPVFDEVPSRETLIRFVNIALLCVEENAEDRPTMNDVVSMLTNESLPLRPPNQPAFSHVRSRVLNDIPRSSNPEKCSANEVRLSILVAR
ncbi:hypothetical protein Patl1_34698 [Pistacia atlantica]|uniref:Uncharacterized protein n=1 Tax=Pistacia atlantica TaxID=434234 RepID=A0ACC0ZWJ7_9ROSI|nr:hypothetical protein Patl1_34698 [Pistacia atlantica]